MKPWQLLLVAALGLNGLVILALFFTYRTDLINSVLAGAIIPVLISSALLFWGGRTGSTDSRQLQKINIIGFLIKVLAMGIWAVILLNGGALDKVTFIVILLINFLAWHGVEAYYWPLFTAGSIPKAGENS